MHKNLFEKIKENFINILTSRLTVLTVIVLLLGGILLYRCFSLQIVQGDEYLNKFVLQIEKTRSISSSRGSIRDRNGVLLAYDELAYSVKIEDVYESGSSKNRALNETLLNLIKMIENNEDSIITDFDIILDENNEFTYSVEGTKLLRFLADVYGYSTIDELDDEERSSTAEELITYLAGTSKFAIGNYEIEGDTKSTFIPGKGYTNNEILQMVTIRYAMSLTAFRKYVGTTVANDISEKTVAVIMENINELNGVTIEEDTVRRYVDSEYFAHILGYTGKISSEELESLNAQELETSGISDRYTINDVVGKSGIEANMETILQGIKGSENVSVDNTGKVISIQERTEPQAGEDVYLTIDSKLQIAAYNILEQKIAGILVDKIVNTKEYIAASNSTSSDIKIPIYDVYFAVINNSIIDITTFEDENVGETEQEVHNIYLDYKQSVYDKIVEELLNTKTPYNQLKLEYQVYQSQIVSLLNKNGIIDSSKVDATDATQIAWATEEVISLNEYLNYANSQRWIDVTKLNLDSQYSDSEEIFNTLCDYIIMTIDNNLEFQKKIYRFMIKNDVISGRQICKILCEQGNVEISEQDEEQLYSGQLSSYQFMMNRITNLEITPAQLALDPCNGSLVISDVDTGEVLALVSYPGYDNNRMANSVDAEYYAQLLSDKSSPLLNYSTQYKGAPGSTYKMVTASAALNEGIITLDSHAVCTGQYTVITPSPWCWRHAGHGSLDVIGAIQNSCNFFFYDAGYKMATSSGSYIAQDGLDTLKKYADLFGLTDKSGVEIVEYAPDVSDELPIPSSIGQGTNSFTSVGLTRYVATIANQGNCYNLTLLNKVTDSAGNIIEEFEPNLRNTVDMPEEYWDAIQTGMKKVVEGKTYFGDVSVQVAGKTGTAEQIKSRPSHALFVGYAPYEEPEISITTRIPFGYSSDYAAQVTRDVIKYYYDLASEEEIITGTADTPDTGVSDGEI